MSARESPSRYHVGVMGVANPRNPPWCAAVLLAVLLPAGSPRAGSGDEALAQPQDAPRIRLERTVEIDRPPGRGSRVLRWVTGIDSGKAEAVVRPYGVAWDDDSLLITDPDAGRVLRLRKRGRHDLSPAGALESPIGIAVCAAGIVVTDSVSGKVALLDPDLHRRSYLAEDLERPTGVACRAERTYVVETAAHRLLILEADGARRTVGGRGSEPGKFNFPTSVALEGNAVWIGDSLNFRVQKIDPTTGEALAVFGQLGDAPGEMPRIKGMAVDRGGQLWVADAHLDRVSVFRADGTFLTDVGRRGTEPGEFQFPAGVAADGSGQIAVVDSFNRRVQVFRLLEKGNPRTVEPR